MPPASRGVFCPRSPILVFFRTRTSISARSGATETGFKNHHKLKPKYIKSSPIEGRAAPRPLEESPAELLSGRLPRKSRGKWWAEPGARRLVGNVIIAVPIIAFAITHFPFSVMTVTGGSMSPMFNPNTEAGDELETRDKMLVTMSRHYKQGDISRGEIVVFKTPHDPNKIAVKRVVALAGDRVLPLPGYQGSEEEQNEGVVVGYNHMWVEGDIDDRKKSVDSNWYGPISQNLVIGRASVLLTPWYRPRWITADGYEWPAASKGRVKYNDVEEAAKDPDHVSSGDFFRAGMVQPALEYMRKNPTKYAQLAATEAGRDKLVQTYQQVRNELKKNDPQTSELAKEFVKEIETVFYRAGGFIENPLFPEQKLIVMQEMAREEARREKSPQAAEHPSAPRVKRRPKGTDWQLAALEREREELDAATERAKRQLRERGRQS